MQAAQARADAPPTKEQLGAAAVTWAAVALADKLDTVVGMFAAGERPTGTRTVAKEPGRSTARSGSVTFAVTATIREAGSA